VDTTAQNKIRELILDAFLRRTSLPRMPVRSAHRISGDEALAS